MTTPADELRQAAATIREVADHAVAGPWVADGHEIYTADRDCVTETHDVVHPVVGTANFDHIALWSPDKALLVAVLLESWIDTFEQIEAINRRHNGAVALNVGQQAAFDLARLINGGAK